MTKKPELIIFAGPNGSGKSSLFADGLRPKNVFYINADDIQRVFGIDNKAAAETAQMKREQCLEKNMDFCYETVFSTERHLDFIKCAKEKGYFIRCYYVVTVDPHINLARVKSRVLSGGHDVPTDKIFSRYARSMQLLKKVIPECDVCHIYDNSSEQPYRIFKKRKDEFFYCTEPLYWTKADIATLTGIDNPKKADLNKSTCTPNNEK